MRYSRSWIVRRNVHGEHDGLGHRGVGHELAEQLGWPEEHLNIEELPPDEGPGNVLVLTIVCEHVTAVFAGFGQRGVPAEAVAAGAAAQAEQYLAASVPIEEYLADHT